MVRLLNLAKSAGSFTLLCSALCAQHQPRLMVRSPQGEAVSLMSTEVPFVISVAVRTRDAAPRAPRIEGIDKVAIKGQTQRRQKTYMNGVAYDEVLYEYTVVADTPGRYVFGPAHVAGYSQLSNTAKITVVTRSTGLQESYEEPRLQLKLAKKAAYVGQRVPFTLRLSWQHPELTPLHVEMPDMPSVKVMNMRKVQQRTERTSTQVTRYIEYAGELELLKEGPITIPALCAEYTMPQSEPRWSNFFSLSMRSKKQVCSEPVPLTIKPLPDDVPVHGLGAYNSYEASMSNSKMERGRAVTLTLELTGTHGTHNLSAPEPDVPQELRVYPSHSSQSEDGTKYTWEYVLQALEEGDYVIPTQHLTFFHPDTETYYSLTTQAIPVHIDPGVQPQPLFTAPPPKSAEPTEVPPVVPVLPTQAAVKIPEALFIMLMLIPPLTSIVRYLFALITRRWGARLYARYILLRGRYALSRYKAHAAADKLYPLVVGTMQEFLGLDIYSEERVLQALAQRAYPQEFQEQVIQYLRDVLEASAFAQHSMAQKDEVATLCKRGEQMFAQLLKLSVMVLCTVGSVYASSEVPVITIPFILLQSGVLVGWWSIWLSFERFSSGWRMVVFLLWLICVGAWLTRMPYERFTYGYVDQPTPVYIGPAEKYPERATLQAGTPLALVKKRGSWYYVSSQSAAGWVDQRNITTE